MLFLCETDPVFRKYLLRSGIFWLLLNLTNSNITPLGLFLADKQSRTGVFRQNLLDIVVQKSRPRTTENTQAGRRIKSSSNTPKQTAAGNLLFFKLTDIY